ncbi:Eco57I restriction-modification methylase domain-containing protein [Bacillus cereus]|uniref:Eco57I restriction-modification methylase domain-containing protein n=1 Tax=Bacillus cereus TaxID=1396 RepID=UPI00397FA003
MIKRNTNNLDFAEKLSIQVNNTSNRKEKKKKGQFFTSSAVANLMASMVNFNKSKIRVLDPGSGTGILIAALVDRIIKEDIKVHLIVDLYENDKEVIPYLSQMMEYCKVSLEKNGKRFTYNILHEDFILINDSLFRENKDGEIKEPCKYDVVISNPPYFKLSTKHQYSLILKEYVHGQPNIYFMFMAVASNLIKERGQLIFITPRSYCSGKYFEKFRKKFLSIVKPVEFHLFESRKEVFKGERIQQELIILNAFKQKKKPLYLKISKSKGSHLSMEDLITVPYDTVIGDEKQKYMIGLPTSIAEVDIMKIFDKWGNTLEGLGMNISTGPVVKFRNKDHIKVYDNAETYPLLHVRHIRDLVVEFPISDVAEEGIIKHTSKKRLLTPLGNYVFLKRITSKEQEKRIECATFIGENYGFEMIGLEDHLNYIYKTEGSMSQEETYGVAAFLNSSLVDYYFRIMNGNTQVNASDLKVIPFPQYSVIVNLGKKIITKELSYSAVDQFLVQSIL